MTDGQMPEVQRAGLTLSCKTKYGTLIGLCTNMSRKLKGSREVSYRESSGMFKGCHSATGCFKDPCRVLRGHWTGIPGALSLTSGNVKVHQLIEIHLFFRKQF